VKTFFVTLHREYRVKVQAETATEARQRVLMGRYDPQKDMDHVSSKVGRAYEEE